MTDQEVFDRKLNILWAMMHVIGSVGDEFVQYWEDAGNLKESKCICGKEAVVQVKGVNICAEHAEDNGEEGMDIVCSECGSKLPGFIRCPDCGHMGLIAKERVDKLKGFLIPEVECANDKEE